MMRKYVARWLVTFCASVAITLIATSAVAQAAGEHRAMTGLCASTAEIAWGPTASHFPQRSYDVYYYPGGSGATSGKCVYAQTQWISGGTEQAVTEQYFSNNGCTGINVRIKNPSGASLGRTAYVHINVSAGIGVGWTMQVSGWTVKYMGTVLNNETQACINNGAWSAPHLHESDSTGVPYNSGLSTGTVYSTGSSSNWMFKYIY